MSPDDKTGRQRDETQSTLFYFSALALGGPSLGSRSAQAAETLHLAFRWLDNYRVLHTYFVNTKSPEYKAPWNHSPGPRVCTPTP